MLVEKIDGRPFWWNRHGLKMRVDSASRTLVIARSTTAALTIRHGFERDEWAIEWQLTHTPRVSSLKGSTLLTSDQMVAAFDLEVRSQDLSGSLRELEQRYQAKHVVPGRFARAGKYLNIPGPGTGCDGDPNISVELTDELKAAVAQLIGHPVK